MWPICFAACTLAPLPALTMHSKYLCHEQSTCVKHAMNSQTVKMWDEGLAWAPWAILAPLYTILAVKSPSPTCSNSAAGLKLHLHDGLVLKVEFGEGSGRCIQWVTLPLSDLGANTGIAVSPQPTHVFKPDQEGCR